MLTQSSFVIYSEFVIASEIITETKTELELLELFLKVCRSVRDPRNKKSRAELAVHAARWEMKFNDRVQQIKPKLKAA